MSDEPVIAPAASPAPPAAPAVKPKTSPAKKIALVVLLLGLVALVLGPFGGATKYLGIELPWTCRGQAKDYQAELEPLIDDWQQAVKLAESTSRVALSPQIQRMQELRSDTAKIEAPSCAAQAREFLLTSMDSTVDGFLSFMKQDPDRLVNAHFDKAEIALKGYATEMATIAGDPEDSVR